jgi:hypothetical protein
MLPTEQFSGDATEDKSPWTPQVWRDGPDLLVAQARQSLFQDRAEVEQGALGASESSVAMSGPVTNPENESDMIIDGSTPGDSPSHGEGGTTRAGIWNGAMQDLRRTEPLANWATGAKSGPANPAP